MRVKKMWNWEKAVEGMQVLLVNNSNTSRIAKGVVTEVKRSNNARMVDGKPIRSSNVESATVMCSDGQEITVKRAESQHQIILE